MDSLKATANGTAAHYDVIVVGAGVGGMYALHHLRSMGLSVRVYEALPASVALGGGTAIRGHGSIFRGAPSTATPSRTSCFRSTLG
jgi:ribulose 1,5-bisphosphate synthetase/thiazole synthase